MPVITVLKVPSSRGGTARRYKIFIDGVERGRLAGGEEIEIEVDVAAGAHEIQARIDWSVSDVVNVSVGDGDTVSLAVAPAAQSSFGQFKTIFGRRSFLSLTLV